MGFMKYAAITLAALNSFAFAARAKDSSKCHGVATIKFQADASDLAMHCSHHKGDVVIDSSAAGSITLDGFNVIDGNLIVENAQNLTAIGCTTLTSIGDTMRLNNLTGLYNLAFDTLKSVGAIDFEALPNLQSLGFTTGVSSAGSVRITNTALASLSGIQLETVGDFDIANNRHLREINVNEIANITGYANFAANSPDLQVAFPNLASVQNMTFRNLSHIELPSLKSTTGLLGFYSNMFTTFTAENLTSTGPLVFADNGYLTELALPQLERVDGGFQIANNTLLKVIDNMNNLNEVKTIDFAGDFATVKLPNLENVSGDFNLQSSSSIDCRPIKERMTQRDRVQGQLTCRSNVADPMTNAETAKGKSGKIGTNKKTSDAQDLGPTALSLMAVAFAASMM